LGCGVGRFRTGAERWNRGNQKERRVNNRRADVRVRCQMLLSREKNEEGRRILKRVKSRGKRDASRKPLRRGERVQAPGRTAHSRGDH